MDAEKSPVGGENTPPNGLQSGKGCLAYIVCFLVLFLVSGFILIPIQNSIPLLFPRGMSAQTADGISKILSVIYSIVWIALLFPLTSLWKRIRNG